MKRLFVMVVIAMLLVACGQQSEKVTKPVDAIVSEAVHEGEWIVVTLELLDKSSNPVFIVKDFEPTVLKKGFPVTIKWRESSIMGILTRQPVITYKTERGTEIQLITKFFG